MQPSEGLFTRQLPGDRYREQTDPAFIKTRYEKPLSLAVRQLLETGFFIEDERKRLTMAKALAHPWIVRKGK